MNANGPMTRSDRVATLEEAKAQFQPEPPSRLRPACAGAFARLASASRPIAVASLARQRRFIRPASFAGLSFLLGRRDGMPLIYGAEAKS